MFNRTNLLILVAALAAGLGLWAAQVWLAMPSTPASVAAPASAATATATRAADLSLRTVRMFPQWREIPPFELQQSDGTALTSDELRGHWTLVFLGFTHCPDICPTTLSDLAQAQKAWADLPADVRPRVLFISADPERDTPARTGEYAAFFHPETLAATAPLPALEAFAASLGLVYMKVATAGGDYSIDHSNALVLLDPQGRQAGLIRPPLVPADIAADLRLLTESGR